MRALTYPHIVSTEDVCGGKARIEGTRIRVIDIVALSSQGLRPPEIIDAYPRLKLAQVHAALTYYYDNQEEVDAEFERAREAEKHFPQQAE